MVAKGKKIKPGDKFRFGDYTVSMFRRPVIDDMEHVKVRELEYFLVQMVDEHLRIEIPETSPSFQYIRHLIEEDEDYEQFIVMMLSNMVFVVNNTDCFFHNAVKLVEVLQYDPLLLEKGYKNSKVSNEGFMEMATRLRDKWLEAYKVELKHFGEKSDNYTDEDAREDAAADTAEEDLNK